jgi:hypothetical protein
MRELVLAFLSWISAETGLTMPPPPLVELVTREEMLERASGISDVRGLYVRGAATVYLRNDWNAADLRSRATLVHELVHHMQFFHDLPSACPAEREQLAYALTLKCLREHGVADPYALLNIDELTVIFLSTCFE